MSPDTVKHAGLSFSLLFFFLVDVVVTFSVWAIRAMPVFGSSFCFSFIVIFVCVCFRVTLALGWSYSLMLFRSFWLASWLVRTNVTFERSFSFASFCFVFICFGSSKQNDQSDKPRPLCNRSVLLLSLQQARPRLVAHPGLKGVESWRVKTI